MTPSCERLVVVDTSSLVGLSRCSSVLCCFHTHDSQQNLPRRVSDDVTSVKRVDTDVTVEWSARSTEHFRPRSEQLLVLSNIATRHQSHTHAIYRGVSEKSSPPPKTFWNIFTSVKSFCVKFCGFVGNSYPHISTNFCRFILIFHQMALIFQRVPMQRFHPVKF